MKTFILLAAIALLGATYYMAQKDSTTQLQSSSEELYTKFVQWKLAEGKQYETFEEEEIRFANFVNSWQFAKNFKSDSMTVGLNKFSDLSSEEFKAIYLGFVPSTEGLEVEPQSHSIRAEIPQNFVWANNSVTAILDQGQCGSCWAFSASEGLTALYTITNKLSAPIQFSPQYLVDCSHLNMGCNGGNYNTAWSYTAKNGISTLASYPYIAKDGKCTKTGDVYHPNQNHAAVTAKNWDDLMTAIYRQPISVAIEADQQIFQGYTGGVLTTGCGNNLDHAVLAIGYNNSASTPYVIIQNSWGTSWGANGWINLSIEGNNGEGQCGFMAQPAYPIA